jgi:hypothetical protein
LLLAYVVSLGKGNLGQGWINVEKEALENPLFEHTNRAKDENQRLAPWVSFLVGSGLIGSHRG